MPTCSKTGAKIDKPFAINVKYLDIACYFDYRRYIDALATRGLIGQAALGRGIVYSVDTEAQINTGYDLLRDDIYAFLAAPPTYVRRTDTLRRAAGRRQGHRCFELGRISNRRLDERLCLC